MAKRITPEDESSRIVERLFTAYGKRIGDRDSFDRSFFEMTEQAGFVSFAQQELVNDAFDEYAKKHGISKEREFTKAKGKDLTKDRLQTRNVVTDLKEYRRKGAKNVDFEGIDTKMRARPTMLQQGNKRPVQPHKSFIYSGVSKGKVVFARQITITIKAQPKRRAKDGKRKRKATPERKQIRYIDHNGRFVKVIKTEQ